MWGAEGPPRNKYTNRKREKVAPRGNELLAAAPPCCPLDHSKLLHWLCYQFVVAQSINSCHSGQLQTPSHVKSFLAKSCVIIKIIIKKMSLRAAAFICQYVLCPLGEQPMASRLKWGSMKLFGTAAATSDNRHICSTSVWTDQKVVFFFFYIYNRWFNWLKKKTLLKYQSHKKRAKSLKDTLLG